MPGPTALPKPIGPTAHGLIDYGYTALQALAPGLFGFKGAARTLCYGFAATQGIVSGLTDYPLGVKRIIPFRLHGKLETPVIAALVLLPWLAGALKKKKSRRYFWSVFAVSLTAYLLTDYRRGENRTGGKARTGGRGLLQQDA